MNKKVRILDSVTWLITRKCKMGCRYCSWMAHKSKEASLSDKYRAIDIMAEWPRCADRFQTLLGGDILWCDGYIDIVKRMNIYNMPYGFCTSAFDSKRMEAVLPYLRNLSISVDPIGDVDFSRWAKASAGLYWAGRLQALNRNVDIHATLTVDKCNMGNVVSTVKMLSAMGIWAEITMVHWHKPGYDLVLDSNLTHRFGATDISKLFELSAALIKLKKDGYKIHTSVDQLASIPSYAVDLNWFCRKPTVLMIDFDLSLRMCLHVPGGRVKRWSVLDLTTAKAWKDFYADWNADRSEYCPGCFWDCAREIEQAGDEVSDWFQHKK